MGESDANSDVFGMKKAYHATRNLTGILKEKVVSPKRLSSVYLFETSDDAQSYCDEFGYEAWITVEYDPRDVLRVWKPKYAPKGVIRLKKGKTATLA